MVASIVDLSQLANVVRELANAVGRLGDSIAHVIKLGSGGVGVLSANRTRERLKDIDARLTIYSHGQAVRFNYLCSALAATGEFPLDHNDWRQVVDQVKEAGHNVEKLLSELQRERSDFVLEEAFGVLISTLTTRLELFDKLSSSPVPRTNEDIAALRESLAEWRRLRHELRKATRHLSIYVKSGASTGGSSTSPPGRSPQRRRSRKS
jgi:hypothetical protein